MVARCVWDESSVDEWANVRKNDKDASVGRIFSIMGEKHAERRLPEAEKEYKARIVFAGNNIQTASGVAQRHRLPRKWRLCARPWQSALSAAGDP